MSINYFITESVRNGLMGLRIFLLLFFPTGIAISSEEDDELWRLEMTIEQEPIPELIQLRKEISDKEKKNQSSQDSSKTMKEKILSFLKEFPEKIAPALKNNNESKQKSIERDSIDGSVSVELSMSGKVHSIDKEYLMFEPALGSEKKIKVPINKITSLSRQLAKVKDGQDDSEGDDIQLGIRPEHLLLNEDGDANWESKVFVVEKLGSGTFLYLEKDGEPLVLQAEGDTNIKVGDTIKVGFLSSRCHLFSKNGNAFK